MAYKKYKLCTFIILIQVVFVYSCQTGIESLGYTYPKGDIAVENGSNLTIICVYTGPAVENASDYLYFQINDNKCDECHTKLNSTAIKLHITQPPKQYDYMYYCKFNDSHVCANSVSVGFSPQDVTDFNCFGHNFENFNCTWTRPKNSMMTTDILKLKVGNKFPKCGLHTIGDKSWCYMALNTTLQYHPMQQMFQFYLYMANRLGTHTQNFTVNHYANVIPDRPFNLSGEATSPHSIILTWSTKMIQFPKDLQHRIMYTTSDREWKLATIMNTDARQVNFTYKLTNLQYAHELYDIRVSMRSILANFSEKMWSENASVTIRTQSKRPDVPPTTDIGSFQLFKGPDSTKNNINVYLYWWHVPTHQRNGENFTYQVERVKGACRHPNECKIDLKEGYNIYKIGYATVSNLSESESYTFNIWSKNEVNLSNSSSPITIPKKSDRLPEPKNFVAKGEDYGDSEVYHLSWTKPTIQPSTYTIFWCKANRRSDPCTSGLEWKVIPGDTNFHTLHLNKALYQFGISANSGKSSSGLVWQEECTPGSKYINKLNHVETEPSSYSMLVKWTIPCEEMPLDVFGFKIDYCPGIKTSLNCTEKHKTETVNGSEIREIIIPDLKPYTTYIVWVSIVSKNQTTSNPSEIIQVVTNAAAPSTPPKAFQITNITTTEIWLKWVPPMEMNGMFNKYEIRINDDIIIIKENVTSFNITNLTPYTTYKIGIKACTVACSKEAMIEGLVTTKMDTPGAPAQPIIDMQNETYFSISWRAPNRPNGKIDYYQVRLKEKQDSSTSGSILNFTGKTTNYLKNCGENNKYNSFLVDVRAVNIIDNGTHSHGNWSEKMESYCPNYSSKLALWLLVPVVILFLSAMAYLSKKLYKHISGIEPKLPKIFEDGLRGPEEFTNWPQEKHEMGNIETKSQNGENTELLKPDNNSDTNDYSSGLESGQGSATSSIRSGTHKSLSDSGTEQRVEDDSSVLAKNTILRQRNVPSTVKSSSGYVTRPVDGTMPKLIMNPEPGNYCKYGGEDMDLPESPITLYPIDAQMAPLFPIPPIANPPFTASDVHTFPNPSYVPHSEPKMQPKSQPNPGYVVTSTTDNLESKNLIRYEPALNEIHPIDLKIPRVPEPVIPENKTSYVRLGEAIPPIRTDGGYVPNNLFEAKSLKED